MLGDELDLFNSHTKRLSQRHGHKVWRLGIDAGFGCPHRKGGRGEGGCAFCSADAGLAAYQKAPRRFSVREQIERAMLFSAKRYGARAFFLYFQAYSCTNLPVEELGPIYDGAIENFYELSAAIGGDFAPGGGASSDIEAPVFTLDGMVVSTRPDCFDESKAALLSSYAKEDFEVWVEFGLQSSHDATLDKVRRGHTSAEYLRAIKAAEPHSPGQLRRAAHLILGLPGESREDMLGTARFVAENGIEGVKFHDLRLALGSALERSFRAGEISLLHPSRLPGLLADCIEVLPPETEIIRLCSDFLKGETLDVFPPPDKNKLYAEVRAELARRGSRQGSRYAR